MLEKTMKQILTKKIKAWKATIEDTEIQRIIDKDLIVTGGCFTSMILNEAPKDYDCYFRTKESVLKVANYYVDKWNEEHGKKKNGAGYHSKVFVVDGDNPSQEVLEYFHVEDPNESRAVMMSNIQKGRVKIIYPSDGVVGDPEEIHASEELGTAVENIGEIDEVKADEILEKEKKEYFPVFISSNAITLSNGVQIVVRFYGEPSDIHDTYDFEHTKAYYDNKAKEVVIPKEVYEMVINKTLRYSGSRYPVCSLFRLRKFINRGWKINAGQILKIAMQVSELNLMDINVLEDQLIGVDSLYFMNLIHQFRKQKEKSPDFELTPNYIISIIDKIF